MRVKQLISLLTKVLEKHGNVRVLTRAEEKGEKPHPRWFRSGAIWKDYESKEDQLVI